MFSPELRFVRSGSIRRSTAETIHKSLKMNGWWAGPTLWSQQNDEASAVLNRLFEAALDLYGKMLVLHPNRVNPGSLWATATAVKRSQE